MAHKREINIERNCTVTRGRQTHRRIEIKLVIEKLIERGERLQDETISRKMLKNVLYQ